MPILRINCQNNCVYRELRVKIITTLIHPKLVTVGECEKYSWLFIS
jgi:hypothetical protein